MKKIEELKTTITPKVFEQVYAILEKVPLEDDYVGEALKLEIWDKEHVSRLGRAKWLSDIWYAYHRPLESIVKMSGMRISQFYRYFGIPRRTFQDWYYGKVIPPVYTLFMMQEVLGYITRY